MSKPNQENQQPAQQPTAPAGAPTNLYDNPPAYQGPPPPYQQHQQNVVVQGAFDAGARFDGIAKHNIPPPPPGCAPNAAQMASMHGQGATIMMTQNQKLSDGGVYTGID